MGRRKKEPIDDVKVGDDAPVEATSPLVKDSESAIKYGEWIPMSVEGMLGFQERGMVCGWTITPQEREKGLSGIGSVLLTKEDGGEDE